MFGFTYYLTQIVDGVAYGSIYGIFALSILLLFRANKLFNFALPQISILCLVIMFFLLKKNVSYFLSLLVTVGFAFVVGFLLHVLVMRFVTERKKVLQSNQSLITIGILAIANSVSSYVIGDEPQSFPSPFGAGSLEIFGVPFARHSLGILAVTVALMVALYLLFKYAKIGLMFEAVAENLEAARLRGLRVSNVLALAWGMAILTGTLGTVLVAPVLFFSPQMLGGVYGYSLMAAVIGGLNSFAGAVVGGIIVGVTENLASNITFIGSELKFVVAMLLMIVILIVRPRGIWGRKEGRRV